MQPVPRRLKASRRPLFRGAAAADEAWPSLNLHSRHLARRLRAIRRGVLVVVWTLLSILVQSVLIVLPGHAKVVFARFYWTMVCRFIGLRVRVIGVPARRGPDGRPVVFVSNHSSWLDIPVLGSRLEACFVSKEEVSRWPLINVVARLGRTVFVQRQRNSTARERDEMRDRLGTGDSLILFPEGTTSDGSRVLPFRSSFLSLAERPVTPEGLPPIVQPVSVVYDRLAYLPTGRATRPLFAWYGDMEIGPHFWRLAQYRGLRASVLLHAPIDPRAFADRKALAQATWATVADGAATLRQNRPARPIGAGDRTADATSPAYA
jgi:1-acyl-sn-glycerol-3-phosphate acyltransferase